MRRTIFLVFLFAVAISSNAQVKYSRQDLAQIKQFRIKGEKAFDDYNRVQAYKVGLFFEKMYDKYKDSSMRSAITYYQLASYTEGDYLHDEQPLAALRLGKIYEKGKGTKTDLHQSLVYYYLGSFKDKKPYERLLGEYCPGDTVVYNSLGKPEQGDSVAIRISPFCKVNSLQSKMVFEQVKALLEKNPEWLAKVEIKGKYPSIAAIYNLWVAFDGMKARYDDVVMGMVEAGVSYDRFIQPQEFLDVSDPLLVNGYVLTIKLVKQKFIGQ